MVSFLSRSCSESFEIVHKWITWDLTCETTIYRLDLHHNINWTSTTVIDADPHTVSRKIREGIHIRRSRALEISRMWDSLYTPWYMAEFHHLLSVSTTLSHSQPLLLFKIMPPSCTFSLSLMKDAGKVPKRRISSLILLWLKQQLVLWTSYWLKQKIQFCKQQQIWHTGVNPKQQQTANTCNLCLCL